MFRVDGLNKAGSIQTPAAAAGGGYFQDTSSPGTVVTADWANMIQEECSNVASAAGQTLSKTTYNQMLTAIQALIGQAIPPGSTQLWLDGAAPTGWVIVRGQAINRAANPVLFGLYGVKYGVGDGSTTFNLPNPQGQHVRIFDNAGTIDPGRTIGDLQGDTLKAHRHLNGISGGSSAQVYATTGNDIPGAATQTVHTDANPVNIQGQTSIADGLASFAATSTETRGKNMSYNLIIKLG